ncbi:MAG: lipid-A-disaccharide synthase N-terminal domain-containing protein [Planctomycetes bacterium]|nr:lipid-A-disaccharide synthase N-terminal domain-containing protein [Planctomycetota bacterium]
MGQPETVSVWWAVFGFVAQGVFAARFLWQWIVSERSKQSMVPVGFWYLSLVGGLMLTVYAIFRDPVLIPGQVAGLLVYVRNLVLIRRARSTNAGCTGVETPAAQERASSRRAA